MFYNFRLLSSQRTPLKLLKMYICAFFIILKICLKTTHKNSVLLNLLTAALVYFDIHTNKNKNMIVKYTFLIILKCSLWVDNLRL